MAKRRTHGRAASGKPITDELVKELADKAEAGYDVDETIRRRSHLHGVDRELRAVVAHDRGDLEQIGAT